LASKTQVSGHWFVRRRLAFAFLRRSVRMDPNPSYWHRTMLLVSVVLGVVTLVGALVYGWFRPAGVIGDSSKIIADRSTGALYIVIDHRLHPALNLVSARLIAGSPDTPTFVSPGEIAKWPKGEPVGIIGAPIEAPATLSPQVSRWAVCDTAPTTVGGGPEVTGIDGQLTFSAAAGELGTDDALLLAYDSGHGPQTYLVIGGVRMPVDLTDGVVTTALGIRPGAPVPPMSQPLYDALPAEHPLTVPTVPGAGQPAPPEFGLHVPVGAVLAGRDVAAGADRFYVVLGDGVQEVSPVTAAMLRGHDSYGQPAPPYLAPDQLAKIPARHDLDIDHYPHNPVHLIDPASRPVTCAAWQWSQTERQARFTVVSGRGLPIGADQQASLVKLVGGGGGVQADQVLVGAEATTFVTSTGGALDSPARGAMWLIAPSGARYGVPFDDDSLSALGLTASTVRPAPWWALQVWPAGPELSKQAALTLHSPADTAVLPTKTTKGG